MSLITRDEILMGRDTEFPLDEVLEHNLQLLLAAINQFRELYGKPMVVSSGYRPGYYNDRVSRAKHSNHIVCLAVDIHDPDGSLDQWITLDNERTLELCGLWREGQAYTLGWTHFQVVPYASYKPGMSRSFKP